MPEPITTNLSSTAHVRLIRRVGLVIAYEDSPQLMIYKASLGSQFGSVIDQESIWIGLSVAALHKYQLKHISASPSTSLDRL